MHDAGNGKRYLYPAKWYYSTVAPITISMQSEIDMRITNAKNCFCHTCNKAYHYLGITRHRAVHREKKEKCTITYTHGDTYIHDFKNRGKARLV